MVSSPTDYPPLDVEAEWSRLDEGLAEIVDAGLVEIHRMENATLRELQRALRRHDYHLFHFIGHGGFDVTADDGVLMLETDQGRAREVSGRQLGTILDDARTIRVAVLNACEGARTSGTDPFAGVAQSLVARGIPAVVAMQFEITDRAAIVFAHEFYTSITDGMAIEGAVGEARRAIFGSKSDVEWGTAVLYMRAEDGRLFDMKALSEPTLVMEGTTVVMEEDIPVVVTSDELPTVEMEPAVPVVEAPVVEAPPVEVDAPPPVVEPPVVEAPPAELVREPVIPLQPEPVVEQSPPVAGFGAKYGRMVAVGLVAAVALIALGINVLGGSETGTTLGPIVEQQVIDADLVIATPTTDVVIDGDLSEWAAFPTAYRLRHPVTNNLSDDRLGSDSTGTLWTAFDGSALYVAVDVVDDIYSQANEGNQIWRGDALNINLFSNAFGEVPARPDPLTFQLTMTPLSQVTGLAEGVLFLGNGDGFADNTTDLPITIAGGETAQGWQLEARIPWAVFKMDGPPPRQLDAALFAVFDNDGESVSEVPVQAAILTNLPGAGFQDPQTWGSFNVE